MSIVNGDEGTVPDIEFGRELDLHHFHPRDTESLVREFLESARVRGLTRVYIIHGKGRSVKKQTVHRILETHPGVERFQDEGSNWGATVVFLRPFSGPALP